MDWKMGLAVVELVLLVLVEQLEQKQTLIFKIIFKV